MANKPALTVEEQIDLLKQRNMQFRDEVTAPHYLKNISYYRLKGYWWDLQVDDGHNLRDGTFFEDILNRYNFDRHLKLILFDAIERIEIALRTKMIYHMSCSRGGLWYTNFDLFNDIEIQKNLLSLLRAEFDRSQEIFIKDHKRRLNNEQPDSWKILEVASMGTLSKIYKNIRHQLPEKAIIASEMGLNLHKELSSWLEAITYCRNIIAHHSRLWSRSMVKKPTEKIINPSSDWLNVELLPAQTKKPFLIISTMLYLCNHVTPGHQIKNKILELFDNNPEIPIYKLGFFNEWDYQPIWRRDS
ncbi:CAAX protease [Pedobacter yonginense]|uniref:CAAX protease n=1 Tax=Pedobacter yonginense TaxID=651869 RepID=A0A317EM40_9SPHI|nr:Abi family protein [Pedobacter yonginense]PWS27881.1 CAAX protease [Pedobacter yonginense]